MRVLVVYAHYSRTSFCHAVMERFIQGLAAAGHEAEVVDLYAMKFNPNFGPLDATFFAHDSVPREILESMGAREAALQLSGGPIKRWLTKRWLKGKDIYDIANAMRQFHPKDVLEQQDKVAQADGLAFIAPVYWMHFPAILKGWLERVFSYGFAYVLTPEGWNGDVSGRVPLMKTKKALIVSTTFFKERDYKDTGIGAARAKLIDDWSFRYPGFRQVQHVYLYAPHAVGDTVRQEYLQRAYALGRDFFLEESTAEPVREPVQAPPEFASEGTTSRTEPVDPGAL